MENSADLLVEKYADLPGSKPVERAIQKKIREGEKGVTTKAGRIEVYLDRLEEFFKDPKKFERLKYKILERYTTKFEEIPESYWKAQEAEMRKRGEGGDWASATEEQRAEVRHKHAEIVLIDQRASLEQWIDYFASTDSNYIPKELKYWVFRNVINLKELENKEITKPDGTKEEKIEFPKRSKGTVSPFPDINQEALNYVIDAIKQKLEGKNIEFGYDIQPQEHEAFRQFLAKEDFAKLYAWANELMHPIPKHLLPVTKGNWVKYEQGSDPHVLVQTIRGRGTGWCTAGENTAHTQLQGGDFYVYYSLDDEGKSTMPRIAIRMEGHDKIAEDPRGIAYKQNLDPYMGIILEEKLKEFGSVGEAYKKKSADMRKLTEIEGKVRANQSLLSADLTFLYEIDSPIEGFGYQKDPRIEELRSQRNPIEDMLIVFNSSREQIARKPKEINKDTKAYVGKLEPGIFDTLRKYNIEHVYTSFPEGKIRIQSLEIGGENSSQLQAELKRNKINVSDYAKDMLESRDFKTLKNPQAIDIVRLTVKDLGFDQYATTDQIFQRAKELGLELCPAEVGPHLRLKDINQPMGKWYFVAMKQIADRNGDPNVFGLGRGGDGLWLRSSWAGPGRRWSPESEFVFGLRK